jgi:plastocyanin
MRLHTLVLVTVTPAIIALASCGDETDQTTSATSTTSAGSTSATTGGTGGAGTTGGTGGMGMGGMGMGGMGMGGMGMGGAGGGGQNFINDCDPGMAADMTGMATAAVNTMGFGYSPKCMRITKGTEVTFNSNFTNHPLRAGEIEMGMEKPDPNSPIKATNSGSMVKFVFPNTGTFGYYCNTHGLSGMYGAIIVE